MFKPSQKGQNVVSFNITIPPTSTACFVELHSERFGAVENVYMTRTISILQILQILQPMWRRLFNMLILPSPWASHVTAWPDFVSLSGTA